MKALSHLLDADAAVTRLSALARLTEEDRRILDEAIADARPVLARSELAREGDPMPRPMLILSGWGAQVRQLGDGRRQVLSLILPGEPFGICRLHEPRAAANIIALTDLSVTRLPARAELPADSGLAAAYDIGRALDEHHLLAQVTRLGRLNAFERIADLMLELHERLALSGLAADGHIPMPLTQELLADLLGLTSVHVNRTLQAMRREEVLTSRSGHVVLRDRERLAEQVDFRPARDYG